MQGMTRTFAVVENEKVIAMNELVYVLKSIDNTLSFILITLLLMLFFKKMG